ncbi:MAG: hypothetical protein CAPSK01_003737 [Candidatus Accumulibacter vicinus]|uniref:Uncharacterized protein n=1 Tax=Candidatus Accumulibacter vicinus TaxID=2954382 RepID=A0A084XWF5_9PROT|nr:MAG: hypothetical protein CAPSK01_003737 [Candidatus Accumulibacter vicinus]
MGKGLEELCHGLRVHPDSGIADGEAQYQCTGTVGAASVGPSLNRQFDLSPLGELHGITDQVGQDLPQPASIGVDHGWQLGGEAQVNCNVFLLRRHGEELGHLHR